MTQVVAGQFKIAFDDGFNTAQRGGPLTACPCRKPKKVAHWKRGWHQGRATKTTPLTRDQQAAAKVQMKKIKQLLN